MRFQPCLLSPLMWDSEYMNIRSAVVQPTCPWSPVHLFFSLFSLCCSGWVISVAVFKFSDSFPCHFLLLSSSIDIFISGIVFFGSKISVGFVFISFIFAVTLCSFADFLLFFICFRCVCSCSLKHFMMAPKILFGNSLCHLSVGIYWSSFLISLEMFLVLAMVRVFFFIETWTFWVLWDSRSYLNLMLWQVISDIASAGEGGYPLLMPVWGWSSGFPLGLCWHSFGEALHVAAECGRGIRPLTGPLQVPSARRVRGGSADFAPGLLWQDPGVEAEGWEESWLPRGVYTARGGFVFLSCLTGVMQLYVFTAPFTSFGWRQQAFGDRVCLFPRVFLGCWLPWQPV